MERLRYNHDLKLYSFFLLNSLSQVLVKATESRQAQRCQQTWLGHRRSGFHRPLVDTKHGLFYKWCLNKKLKILGKVQVHLCGYNLSLFNIMTFGFPKDQGQNSHHLDTRSLDELTSVNISSKYATYWGKQVAIL